MPSHALQSWEGAGRSALDEIAAAHAAVGGSGPGRRYATQEINHAFAVLLASRFQGFCRDLHTETAVHFVAAVSPAALGSIVRSRLLEGRKLDHGNPNPGNIGADFGRFGIDLWKVVQTRSAHNKERQTKLERLCEWRNAIAHQDFTRPLTPPPPLRLATVKEWRKALNALATELDRVLADHLDALVGKRPW